MCPRCNDVGPKCQRVVSAAGGAFMAGDWGADVSHQKRRRSGGGL